MNLNLSFDFTDDPLFNMLDRLLQTMVTLITVGHICAFVLVFNSLVGTAVWEKWAAIIVLTVLYPPCIIIMVRFTFNNPNVTRCVMLNLSSVSATIVNTTVGCGAVVWALTDGLNQEYALVITMWTLLCLQLRLKAYSVLAALPMAFWISVF